jgi:hypothetical protein
VEICDSLKFRGTQIYSGRGKVLWQYGIWNAKNIMVIIFYIVVITGGVEFEPTEYKLAVLHFYTLSSFDANVEEMECLSWVDCGFDNLDLSLKKLIKWIST